jgi:prepilin-type N-terminal cleavage/methylation domain-containing protein
VAHLPLPGRPVQRLIDMEHHNHTDRGFTLIELLIVIVILGVLSTVTVFAVNGITDDGQRAVCEHDHRAITSAVEQYRARFGEYPATMSDMVPTVLRAESQHWEFDGTFGAVLLSPLSVCEDSAASIDDGVNLPDALIYWLSSGFNPVTYDIEASIPGYAMSVLGDLADTDAYLDSGVLFSSPTAGFSNAGHNDWRLWHGDSPGFDIINDVVTDEFTVVVVYDSGPTGYPQSGFFNLVSSLDYLELDDGRLSHSATSGLIESTQIWQPGRSVIGLGSNVNDEFLYYNGELVTEETMDMLYSVDSVSIQTFTSPAADGAYGFIGLALFPGTLTNAQIELIGAQIAAAAGA